VDDSNDRERYKWAESNDVGAIFLDGNATVVVAVAEYKLLQRCYVVEAAAELGLPGRILSASARPIVDRIQYKCYNQT
jgi:hypothetical protein